MRESFRGEGRKIREHVGLDRKELGLEARGGEAREEARERGAIPRSGVNGLVEVVAVPAGEFRGRPPAPRAGLLATLAKKEAFPRVLAASDGLRGGIREAVTVPIGAPQRGVDGVVVEAAVAVVVQPIAELDGGGDQAAADPPLARVVAALEAPLAGAQRLPEVVETRPPDKISLSVEVAGAEFLGGTRATHGAPGAPRVGRRPRGGRGAGRQPRSRARQQEPPHQDAQSSPPDRWKCPSFFVYFPG
jgi:hypothetical protein